MAKEYDIKVPAHKSIYSPDPKDRELNIYFCEPEQGINEDTGIVLLIAGFGANSNSKVYKKMRREFADKHNLVTVQCDYFGYEFMQDANKLLGADTDIEQIRRVLSEEDLKYTFENEVLSFEALLQVADKYNHKFVFWADADLSDENVDDFNDMGIMQATDNIYAVLYVINILLDNNMHFNAKKIIIYGYSQGAYLAHLCNIMAPTLFNLIIDNSAWIYPKYMESVRLLDHYYGDNTLLCISFDYFAKRNIINKKLYYIEEHYKNIKNSCRIISFHGVEDDLISSDIKKNFCNSIDKCDYIEITQDKVDGTIFKSCKHGLDADFLNMFDHVLNKFDVNFSKDEQIDLIDKIILEADSTLIKVNYNNILPSIEISSNKL